MSSTATADTDRRPALTVVEAPAAEVPAEVDEAPVEATNAPRARARAWDLVFRVARSARPPELWATDRPSLRATYRHAIWGEHVPSGTVTRGAYITAWALVCAPAVAVFYLLAWAHERPLRTVGFWVLVWAVWQVAPVRAVLGFAAHWNVPSLAAHFVTNIGG